MHHDVVNRLTLMILSLTSLRDKRRLSDGAIRE